jgi:hypothetical protein
MSADLTDPFEIASKRHSSRCFTLQHVCQTKTAQTQFTNPQEIAARCAFTISARSFRRENQSLR